jgi:hypothetical protein
MPSTSGSRISGAACSSSRKYWYPPPEQEQGIFKRRKVRKRLKRRSKEYRTLEQEKEYLNQQISALPAGVAQDKREELKRRATWLWHEQEVIQQEIDDLNLWLQYQKYSPQKGRKR